jgi:diguanylate cyclase (GGDEF)-like protein
MRSHSLKTIRIIHVKSVKTSQSIAGPVIVLEAQSLGADEVSEITCDSKSLSTQMLKTPPDLLVFYEASQLDLANKIRKKEKERLVGMIFCGESHFFTDFFAAGVNDCVLPNISSAELSARAHSVLTTKFLADRLRRANHRLLKMSHTDSLTGLANMRAFQSFYASAMEKCFAGRSPLGIIMIDLDNFKRVNDKCNHLVGSHVISEVGRLMIGAKPLGDKYCFARFGGDEYVLCTDVENVAQLENIAERLRKLITQSAFIKDGFKVEITPSLGVCWIAPGFQGGAMDPVKIADLMLYQSKAKGKNQFKSVAIHSTEEARELLSADQVDHGQLSSRAS